MFHAPSDLNGCIIILIRLNPPDPRDPRTWFFQKTYLPD